MTFEAISCSSGVEQEKFKSLLLKLLMDRTALLGLNSVKNCQMIPFRRISLDITTAK